MMFVNRKSIDGTWQNFERLVCRYLSYKGFECSRIVGTTGDKGADIIAHKNDKRWLFQVKHWKNRVGGSDVAKTIKSLSFYGAQIPTIVSRNGFDKTALRQRNEFFAQGISCQLWIQNF